MIDTGTVEGILICLGIIVALWAARRIILQLLGVGIFVLIVVAVTRPGFGDWLQWTWEAPNQPLQSCLSMPSGAVAMDFALNEQVWIDKYSQARMIGPADGNNVAAAGFLLYVVEHPELKGHLNGKAGICQMAIETSQGWVAFTYALKNDNSLIYYYMK